MGTNDATTVNMPKTVINSTDCQCFFENAHEPHDWAYTSEGGGHMVSVDDTDSRGYRKWHCPGLTEMRSMEVKLTIVKAGVDALSQRIATAEADNREKKKLLADVRMFAEGQAIRARALGHSDDERGWLDLLVVLGVPK